MELKIKVTGSVILTEELQSYIEKKVEKLAVFLKNDSTAITEIEAGTTSSGQRTGDVFRGEVHTTFAGGDVYAEAVQGTLHGALDQAIGEARRKLKKGKSKDRDLVRKGATQVKTFFRNFGK